MISITLSPSLIVLRDLIQVFEHWLRILVLRLYRRRIFSINTYDENVQTIGGILHPFGSSMR